MLNARPPRGPVPASVPTKPEPTPDAAGQVNVRVLEATIQIPPRTLPAYLENIKVNLTPQVREAEGNSSEARFVLSIKSVDIVLGQFDPERFVEFMERNRDYVGRVLPEKLAGANVKLLADANGERYLKNLILDAIGEITSTNRHDRHVLAGAGSVAYHGAVDVSLPQSFTVESIRPDQTASPAEKHP